MRPTPRPPATRPTKSRRPTASHVPPTPSPSPRSTSKHVVADAHDDGARPNPRAYRLARIPKEQRAVGRIPAVQRVARRVVRLGRRLAAPDEAIADRLKGQRLVGDAADGVGKLRAVHPVQDDGGHRHLAGVRLAFGLGGYQPGQKLQLVGPHHAPHVPHLGRRGLGRRAVNEAQDDAHGQEQLPRGTVSTLDQSARLPHETAPAGPSPRNIRSTSNQIVPPGSPAYAVRHAACGSRVSAGRYPTRPPAETQAANNRPDRWTTPGALGPCRPRSVPDAPEPVRRTSRPVMPAPPRRP